MLKLNLVYKSIVLIPPLLAIFLMLILQIDFVFFTKENSITDFSIKRDKPNYRSLVFYLNSDSIIKKIDYNRFLKIKNKKKFIVRQSNIFTIFEVKGINWTNFMDIILSMSFEVIFIFVFVFYPSRSS